MFHERGFLTMKMVIVPLQALSFADILLSKVLLKFCIFYSFEMACNIMLQT